MAPKKAVAKQADKIAIDKTFGMKNKNKSKQVQNYIKSISQNAAGRSNRDEQMERKAKSDQEKQLQKAALTNALFNMGTDKKGRSFDPEAKKRAKQMEEDAIAAGKKVSDAIKKQIIEGLANTIRLTNAKGVRLSEVGGHPIMTALKDKHADTFKVLSILAFIKANDKVFWIEDAESTNPILRMQEDVDLEVMPDGRPIEDIIEEKRAALPPGGTPVTADTFKAWKERKEKEKAAETEAARQDAIAKQSKGKSVLSGRDLFIYDASLFVDDEGAVDVTSYERAEDPEYDDDENEKEKDDEDEDEDEDEEDTEEPAQGGARGSNEPAPVINKDLFLEGDVPDDLDDLDDEPPGNAVQINKDLFLEGDDLPDDLDDLDDD